MITSAKSKSAIVELKAILEHDRDRWCILPKAFLQALLEQEMAWASPPAAAHTVSP